MGQRGAMSGQAKMMNQMQKVALRGQARADLPNPRNKRSTSVKVVQIAKSFRAEQSLIPRGSVVDVHRRTSSTQDLHISSEMWDGVEGSTVMFS